MAPFLSQSTCSYTLQDLFSPNVFPCFHYLHTCLHDMIFQCLFSLVSSFLDILGMFFFQFLPTFFPMCYINFHTCFFLMFFSSLMFMCFIKCRTIFPWFFSHVHPNSLRVLILVPAIFRFFSHFHDISSLFQPFSHGFPQVFGPFLRCLPPWNKACGVEDGASGASAAPAAVTAFPPAVAEARAEAWRGERWKIYGKYGGLLERYGK